MKAALAVGAALLAGAACAQSVALQGMLGRKALLMVDGSPPKTVAPGETFAGVKVVSTSGDEALVEVGGQRYTLRVGESPASVGSTGRSAGGGGRIVMTAGSGGHFLTQGAINGQVVRFMVDTGATSVAMSEAEARRIGLEYKSGTQGMASTANGPAPVWHVRLRSVRIGEVEVHDVAAAVLPAAMPHILLGNSFLERFQMRRENDTMVLDRRY